MGNKRIILEGILLQESKDAYLIDFEGDEHWVPQSLCTIDDKNEEVEIERWKAQQLFPGENL